MEYIKLKDKIIISATDDFNPQHILECGQIFDFKKIENGYEVCSHGNSAVIKEVGSGYEILTSNVEYFEKFFDLKTDYAKIKRSLLKFDMMKEPIKFGKGIRILKNDLFETMVSFIISANNNIKRIQKIIWALKEKCNGGKSFPSHEELKILSVDDLYAVGLGYRAPQLYKALRQVDEATLAEWQSLDSVSLRAKLISLSGIGPKVADCVLLFGYGRGDVYPVDTWMNKMYNLYFEPLSDRKKIAQNLVDMFGALAGYAQQYLFYYQRSH